MKSGAGRAGEGAMAMRELAGYSGVVGGYCDKSYQMVRRCRLGMHS